MNTVVVVGFGSFGDVTNNPSAAIAAALDGCVLDGVAIVEREMPVSYDRSIGLCALLLARTRAVALIGIGVAMDRSAVAVDVMGDDPRPPRALMWTTALRLAHFQTVPTELRPPWIASGWRTVWAWPSVTMPAITCATVGCIRRLSGSRWMWGSFVPPLGMDSGSLLSAIASMSGDGSAG